MPTRTGFSTDCDRPFTSEYFLSTAFKKTWGRQRRYVLHLPGGSSSRDLWYASPKVGLRGIPTMWEEIKMLLALGMPVALGIYLIGLLRGAPSRKKRKAK